VEISPGKTSNLQRAPTASTQRPLDGHRASPCRASSPGPPRLIRAAHRHHHGAPCVPRVATSSPASFPPSSRSSSCHRLVVGAINLHGGLAPPSCWSCWAHSGSRGGYPPRLPQNRTYAVRIRLFGTAGYDPRRRPVCDLEVIPITTIARNLIKALRKIDAHLRRRLRAIHVVGYRLEREAPRNAVEERLDVHV
jgi:hypothetical protein